MALRDQPYLPLYVQDYLTDERLNMCSWATQGIYIKIMCVLHKQEQYGSILFKQNSKQNLSNIEYFASVFVKNLPCQLPDMIAALTELVDNGVLIIDDDGLHQKRMKKDGETSLKRSKAAKSGGGNPVLFKQKRQQIDKQNPENEIENEIGIVNTIVDRTNSEDAIHHGQPNGHKITIKKVYVTDKVHVIHDLAEYFKYTNQYEEMVMNGLDKFEDFMKENPANVFNDTAHLYNSFRAFCLKTKTKSRRGKFVQ
jgi:uncharacterized protein YdaU (DUF1376 family)